MATTFEQMRANVGKLLRGIDRYNPENLATLERYVDTQARENAYDLEANLAVLKLYQFNPAYFQTTVTAQILLKALTNLPHTDFTLCKCMIDQTHASLEENRDLIDGITGFEESVRKSVAPARLVFVLILLCMVAHWCRVDSVLTYDRQTLLNIKNCMGDHPFCPVLYSRFQSSFNLERARRLPCCVPLLRKRRRKRDTQVKVWMNKYGWTENEDGQIFIHSQEECVKPKNIVEKIDFESVSSIMATSQ
ncbi:Eukaryotic translation initiation factor 3 subunit K [Anabarilius grahami]|uniref:Eukaryotic translation initiation factor 3 subunit K n=1 Tax=Anabarilius grahami TaxID=495550 RepID=A0A3N0Z8E8_ANAGA|nr:Eukaryotic translation initiation factor 3 subunit K [Anabarilius grahami]